ncbi:hypothetical protein BDN71DRAFT_1455817 [Pleurotus eryngii]|uniref:Uncharacterized protein n=1 Tax=Pleurotus eryngii TaxID=5323 RepID=A0A9P6DAG3_PLEER|nr:hypothetical protein BDN71DRAFT_1455817 [Pleurotus eryngii]
MGSANLEMGDSHDASAADLGLRGWMPPSLANILTAMPSTRSPSPDSFPTPSQLLSDIAKAAPAPLPPRQGSGGRKQRTRLASLGFQPTDPESISSHDRKRYYLECIESYSLYLQDRVRAAGFMPVPIQRVIPHSPSSPANSSMGGGAGGGVGPIRNNHHAHRALCSDAGKGLSIESMRTLLVHMESTARKLNEQTLVEEQQFAKLRAQYEALHANDHPHPSNHPANNTLPNDTDSPYHSGIGSIGVSNGSELSENSASTSSSPLSNASPNGSGCGEISS